MADQLVGYRYYFGIHMGISLAADELVEVKVGDRWAWRGSAGGNGPISIDAPELFGGDDGEGGIVGTLWLLFGHATQVALTGVMDRVLKTPMPGFRRRFTAFFDGQVSAINPYPKPWKFRVRRVLGGWQDDTPWFPAYARIDLIRSVSEAETGSEAGTTIEEIFSSQICTVTRNTVDGFLHATFIPEGDLIELTGVKWLFVTVDSEPMPLIEGTHWVEGSTPNDIVFPSDTVTVGIDYIVGLEASTVSVEYRQNIETIAPGDGSEGTVLIRAMNPAHIIYECYTNRQWGRGLPAARLDDTTFEGAAIRLHAEGFGLCLRWNRTDEIETFIQGILDYIGGVIYIDRQTAKIKLTLIRDDYVTESLQIFDVTSGLLAVKDAPISAAPLMINKIVVKYRDPVSNTERSVNLPNVGAIQAAGGQVNSSTLDFQGLPTASLASRVAKRELRARGTVIRRFELEFDRRAFNIVPGQMIRIRDVARNIPLTAVRIGQVDYGSLGSGVIRAIAVQDVFGLPAQGFGTIGPATWTPPNKTACVGDFRLFEMPYRSVFRRNNAADLDYIDPNAAFVATVLDQGQSLNLSHDLAVKSGAVHPTEVPPSDVGYCGYSPSPTPGPTPAPTPGPTPAPTPAPAPANLLFAPFTTDENDTILPVATASIVGSLSFSGSGATFDFSASVADRVTFSGAKLSSNAYGYVSVIATVNMAGFIGSASSDLLIRILATGIGPSELGIIIPRTGTGSPSGYVYAPSGSGFNLFTLPTSGVAYLYELYLGSGGLRLDIDGVNVLVISGVGSSVGGAAGFGPLGGSYLFGSTGTPGTMVLKDATIRLAHG